MPSGVYNIAGITREGLFTDARGVEYWPTGDIGEQYIRDAATLTVRYQTRYETSDDFVRDMVGDAYMVGSDTLSRELPATHPDNPNMYVDSCRLVGTAGWPSLDDNGAVQISAGTEKNAEGLAIYEVTYRSYLYDLLDDDEILLRSQDFPNGGEEILRFVETNMEPSAENLPIPNRVLYYYKTDDPADGLLLHKGAPQLVNTHAPFLFPKNIITLRWTMIPPEGIPLGVINDMEGKVNSEEFVVPWPKGKSFTYAPETLLFLSGHIRPYIHQNRNVFVDLEYMFEFRKNTHNRFLYWPSDPPSFKRVRWGKNTSAPERSLFKADDFYKLFQVTTANETGVPDPT